MLLFTANKAKVFAELFSKSNLLHPQMPAGIKGRFLKESYTFCESGKNFCGRFAPLL